MTNNNTTPVDGPGPSGFLHPDAEIIIKTKLNDMFAELAKLPYVEYMYKEDDGTWCKCELNSDTSFREQFYQYVGELLAEGLRSY